MFFSFDRGVLSVFAPGGACRYNPTCSEYTKQKIKKFGVSRGILFGLKRIWSCR
ncbi:MAG: membrane protein insertion efficiency factor YidD [Candidatus Daviesbacteria bacterium]|nr:membrane protein insertion efficiency factor YidD [Candidatus Daviesbacteria bacterium]